MIIPSENLYETSAWLELSTCERRVHSTSWAFEDGTLPRGKSALNLRLQGLPLAQQQALVLELARLRAHRAPRNLMRRQIIDLARQETQLSPSVAVGLRPFAGRALGRLHHRRTH